MQEGRVTGPFTGVTPAELEPVVGAIDLDRPLGEPAAALDELDRVYLHDAVYFHHPRYLAHLNCPVVIPALLGEAVRRAGGHAPSVLAKLRILASECSHFSVVKAARLMGLGDAAVISVPCDRLRHLRTAALAGRLAQVKRDGLIPMAVVATAGTTDFGSIDPLGREPRPEHPLQPRCHSHRIRRSRVRLRRPGSEQRVRRRGDVPCAAPRTRHRNSAPPARTVRRARGRPRTQLRLRAESGDAAGQTQHHDHRRRTERR